MNLARPKLFDSLVSLATELMPLVPGCKDPYATFDMTDSSSFILRRDAEPYRYQMTPLNSDTFAVTRVDGDHFGFLQIEGRSPDQFPVVLTSPMAYRPLHILAESFYEFLCLGCMYGYGALAAIAYDREEIIEQIQSGRNADENSDDPPKVSLLPILRKRLNLAPLPNVRARLDELQQRWMPLVVLSEEGRQIVDERATWE